MKIVVDQISEDEGLRIQNIYPKGEPALTGEGAHLIGNCEVSLQATRAEKKVQLVGSISALVEFECDRCLTGLEIPVEESFDLLYVPPLGSEEEHELDEKDLSLGFYQDGVIDLDDIAREQIELALPMARLCAEDCRGLCTECGTNLNLGECSCKDEQTDDRWVALKELKSKLN